jgi:glycosyltransferase involved in cell wall biosynthesis
MARFVFISTMCGARWGGSEELWTRTAAHLRRAGCHVGASVQHWPELAPQIQELQHQGVDIFVRKPASRSLGRRLWRRISSQFRPPVSSEEQWLRRQKPDLVIISQGGNTDGMEWMHLCRTLHQPYVLLFHCNSEQWWPCDALARELLADCRSARRVFAVSQHNLHLLEKQIAARLPNASIVRNPFNVPAGPPPAWPGNTPALRFACVGRLEPAAKGQDVLLNVLNRPEWRARPIEVNFYGGGASEAGLKTLASNLKLSAVHFRGHVADVRRIWEHNHLLLLPSRYEGLPLALVEAMWCGRPAVVTDVGGNSELCQEGATGFVAPAPVESLFAEAMERAWARRDEWPAMGAAGRTRIEQEMPAEPVAEFCRILQETAAASDL